MLKPIIRDNKIITIPNVLSMLRILLIPAIVYYLNFECVLAFGFLLLSGITDVLDGWIARKFNMTSDLGIVLDPVADKLTQGCVILAIAKSTPFVDEIMSGDQARASFLQRALGYALSGDTRFECLFILYGATTRNDREHPDQREVQGRCDSTKDLLRGFFDQEDKTQ